MFTPKFTYRWSFSNFEEVQRRQSFLDSPRFDCEHHPDVKNLSLRLFPKGFPGAPRSDLLVFLLVHWETHKLKPFVNLIYKMRIECDQKQSFEKEFAEKLQPGSWKPENMFFVSGLEQTLNRIRDFDVYFEGQIIEDEDEFVQIHSAIEKRHNWSHLIAASQTKQDFAALLQSGQLADVDLVVGGVRLPAHKAILSARSKVFAAMFAHDTKEEQQNEVNISDLTQQTCNQMLLYIYTGTIDDTDIVDQLLFAADKYDLPDLKADCETILCSKATLDNAVDLLLLAELYNADKLMRGILEFFHKHASMIVKTEPFKELAKKRPDLFVRLYTDLVEKLVDYKILMPRSGN